MSDRIGPDDKAAVAARARRTLTEWQSGMNYPPELAFDERERWRDRRWNDLCDEIREDPQTWFDVSLSVIEETPWQGLDSIGRWPLRALLVVGGDVIEDQAIAAARGDRKVAGMYVQAMEYVVGDHDKVWSGLTEVVRRLGIDVAIAANARQAEAATQSSHDDHLDSPDFWAFGLGGHLAMNDPELAWTFVLGVIATVPEVALAYVGAGELEDFCWNVAPAFIDRIEAEAARDRRFRLALGSVWPGGKTIPPEIYGRIRAAAERVVH